MSTELLRYRTSRILITARFRLPDTRRTARKPYPLSWNEPRRLFALLPATIAQLALFAVNTGCREQEVCQLRWAWEVPVPELETSMFVIPAQFDGSDAVNSGAAVFE